MEKQKRVFYFLKFDFLKLFIIFSILFFSSFLGFLSSIKRERDIVRNSDISVIAKAIEDYRRAFGVYPDSSEDGKIIACGGPQTDLFKDENGYPVKEEGAVRYKLTKLVPCDWGKDALRDALDGNYPPFLDRLPQDPLEEKGFSYSYKLKDGNYFVYVAYETKKMPDYSGRIFSQKISCGVKYCNAARTNGIAIVD